MLTRCCWSLVELVSRLLDPPERDAVRGDLAEFGAGACRTLGEVIGLVVRRQAAHWVDWRPWFALVAVVIPIGVLLSYVSRWWGITTGIDLANYWVLWDFSYLAYPGYRNDVIRTVVWIGGAWCALIGWSWTSDNDARPLARPRHRCPLTSGLDPDLFQVMLEMPYVVSGDEFERDITI